MSESRFCKTLDKLQRKEQGDFVKAVDAGNVDKASRILESIDFMSEVSSNVCFIGTPSERRKRR